MSEPTPGSEPNTPGDSTVGGQGTGRSERHKDHKHPWLRRGGIAVAAALAVAGAGFFRRLGHGRGLGHVLHRALQAGERLGGRLAGAARMIDRRRLRHRGRSDLGLEEQLGAFGLAGLGLLVVGEVRRDRGRRRGRHRARSR